MGHIIDSTYIYGTFFAVIPYVKVTLMITFLSVGLGTILGLLSCVLQQIKCLCSVSSATYMYYCAVVFRTWFSYTSCTMVYQFYSSR